MNTDFDDLSRNQIRELSLKQLQQYLNKAVENDQRKYIQDLIDKKHEEHAKMQKVVKRKPQKISKFMQKVKIQKKQQQKKIKEIKRQQELMFLKQLEQQQKKQRPTKTDKIVQKVNKAMKKQGKQQIKKQQQASQSQQQRIEGPWKSNKQKPKVMVYSPELLQLNAKVEIPWQKMGRGKQGKRVVKQHGVDTHMVNGVTVVDRENRLPLKSTGKPVTILMAIKLIPISGMYEYEDRDEYDLPRQGQRGQPQRVEFDNQLVHEHDINIVPVQVQLNEDGKFDEEDVKNAGMELLDNYPYISDNNLQYYVKVGQVDNIGKVMGGNVNYANDIYKNNVLIHKGRSMKLRNLYFNSEYEVNATADITRYHLMTNMREQKRNMNCRLFVCSVLLIPYDPNATTNVQMIDHIRKHTDKAYILGNEDKPYDHRIHKYQIAIISGHIYISKSGKQLIKSPQTLYSEINDKQPVIVSDKRLQEIYDETMAHNYVPYYKPGMLLLRYNDERGEMYITKKQDISFKLSEEFYGKRQFKFTFLHLFDKMKYSECEMIGYKFKAWNYNSQREHVQCYDMNKSYPTAFWNLSEVYQIKGIRCVFDRLWNIELTKAYYVVNFKMTGNDMFDSMTHRINTVSDDTIRLYDDIARKLGLGLQGYVYYKYEIGLVASKDDVMAIKQQMEGYSEMAVRLGVQPDKTICGDGYYEEFDYKVLRCSIWGTMESKQKEIEQQCMYDKANDKCYQQLMQLYNKQLTQEGMHSNYQFIHCQMINKQTQMLIQPFIGCLSDISGIATDAVYIDKVMEVQIDGFKQKAPKCGVSTLVQLYMNKTSHTTEIIQSEAGHGKTRYISQNADKDKDVIIVVSLDNKAGYVNQRFKNVMTYQQLVFSHTYQFVLQYNHVYVDEWALCPLEFILQLHEVCKAYAIHEKDKDNDRFLTLVGDVNQNIHVGLCKSDYYKFAVHIGFKWLEVGDQYIRNKVNVFRYINRSKMKVHNDARMAILKDMVTYGIVRRSTELIVDKQKIQKLCKDNGWDCDKMLKSRTDFVGMFNSIQKIDEQCLIDNFNKGSLILIQDNKKVFQVNMIYQSLCLKHNARGNVISKVHGATEPYTFSKLDGDLYLDDNGKQVPAYYGCAKTIYSAQGGESKNILVIVNGTESFEQLYVAFTRIVEDNVKVSDKMIEIQEQTVQEYVDEDFEPIIGKQATTDTQPVEWEDKQFWRDQYVDMCSNDYIARQMKQRLAHKHSKKHLQSPRK